jgi:hypothetical protein
MGDEKEVGHQNTVFEYDSSYLSGTPEILSISLLFIQYGKPNSLVRCDW